MFAPCVAKTHAKKTLPSPSDRTPPRLHSSRLSIDSAESVEVLNSHGHGLPEQVRTPMENAFDFNFATVRVHDDSAARRSAASIGARGWTWGEHVVLGPQAGPETLVHELAHVVQQSGAPADQQLGAGVPEDALEQDASRAAHSGRQPMLRTSSRMVQMQPQSEPGSLQLRQPGLGQRQERSYPGFAPGRLEFRLQPDDQQHIDAYLRMHGFALQQMQPALDGAIVTVDQIVDRVRPLVLPLIEREAVQRYIEGKIQSMKLDALLHPHLTGMPQIPTQLTLPLDMPAQGPATGQPRRENKPIQGWQTVLGVGGQIAWHVNLATGKPASTPQDVTLQFQAARNFVGHPENESGSELQGLVQFGYNITTGQVSILSGAQYTEVFSLFNGLLQLGGFAQVLAGVAVGGGSVSGQIQPSVGAQAVVTIGPLQLGAQASRGVTFVPGGESTQDTSAALVLQYSF